MYYVRNGQRTLRIASKPFYMKYGSVILLFFVLIRCAGPTSKAPDGTHKIEFISIKPKLESRPDRKDVVIRDLDSLSQFSNLREVDSIVSESTLRVGNIERNNFGFNEIYIRYSDGSGESLMMLFNIFNGVLFKTTDGKFFINDKLALLVETFVVG